MSVCLYIYTQIYLYLFPIFVAIYLLKVYGVILFHCYFNICKLPRIPEEFAEEGLVWMSFCFYMVFFGCLAGSHDQ